MWDRMCRGPLASDLRKIEVPRSWCGRDTAPGLMAPSGDWVNYLSCVSRCVAARRSTLSVSYQTPELRTDTPGDNSRVWSVKKPTFRQLEVGYHSRTLAFLSSLMRRGAVALVRRYQRRAGSRRPARCRYHPSCSTYAIEAIERYGLLVGGTRAVRRILRCRPPFWGVDEP